MKVLLCVYLAFVAGIESAAPSCDDVPAGDAGVFPEPTDCTQYWECINGTVSLRECDSGFYFNPVLESCDFPDASGCVKSDAICDGLPPAAVVSVPNPTNCSLYYECFDGIATSLECPGGLYFNPVLESCDFPAASGCLVSTPPPTTGGTVSPICAGFPTDHVVSIPEPTNCSLYWECFHGEATLLECPGGLYFNPVLESCDFPDASGCLVSTPPPTPTPTTGGTVSPICAGFPTDHVVSIPEPTNCSLYWECFHGEATLLECPGGLYFNPVLESCDFPDASGCTVSTVTPSIPTTPSHSEVCDGLPPTVVVAVPEPSNCSLYWECYDGFGTLEQCADGLFFNPSSEACDFEDISQCINPTTPSTTTKGPFPDCTGIDLGYYPHPYDCTHFFECYYEHAYEMSCPPGLWFDSKSSECVDPSLSDCTRK